MAKETELVIKKFTDRLTALDKSTLTPEVKLEAMKIFRDEVRASAPDWRVFGLGGSKEDGLAQRGARTINEAEVLIGELQKTSMWTQLQPLLQQLAQKFAGQTGGTPTSTTSPTTAVAPALPAPVKAPPSIGAAVGKPGK